MPSKRVEGDAGDVVWPADPGPRDRWVTRDGWMGLTGFGPGPFTADEFLEAAGAYAERTECSVEDVLRNGPYEFVRDYVAEETSEAVEPPAE